VVYGLGASLVGERHVVIDDPTQRPGMGAQEIIDQLGWFKQLGVTMSSVPIPPVKEVNAYLDYCTRWPSRTLWWPISDPSWSATTTSGSCCSRPSITFRTSRSRWPARSSMTAMPSAILERDLVMAPDFDRARSHHSRSGCSGRRPRAADDIGRKQPAQSTKPPVIPASPG
jgi:hypothetical protein